MIDIPNLVVGFVLGVLGTLPFWVTDRRREQRERRAEWTRAMRNLDALVRRGTNAMELDAAIESYPLDQWRRQLGPEGFIELEEVERAYWAVEWAAQAQDRAELPLDPARPNVSLLSSFPPAWWRAHRAFLDATDRLGHAQRIFRDLCRDRYEAELGETLRRENRQEALRHPVKRAGRSYRNWRTRRSVVGRREAE